MRLFISSRYASPHIHIPIASSPHSSHLLQYHSILLPAHVFPCLFILRCILRRIQSPIVSADHLLARVHPGYTFVEPREFPSLRPSDRVTNSLVCSPDNSSSKLVNFRLFGTRPACHPSTRACAALITGSLILGNFRRFHRRVSRLITRRFLLSQPRGTNIATVHVARAMTVGFLARALSW